MAEIAEYLLYGKGKIRILSGRIIDLSFGYVRRLWIWSCRKTEPISIGPIDANFAFILDVFTL